MEKFVALREYEKNFDEWSGIKKLLDKNNFKPPLFKEREIWWCSFGANIGSEVCGKNSYFRRPVLVFKKLSRISFIGMPLSSKNKEGSWYVSLTHSNGMTNSLNLAQVRYFDYRRLDKKIGSVDTVDFKNVKSRLAGILGITCETINPRS